MEVSIANKNDISELEVLCSKFHYESGTNIKYNVDKVYEVLNTAIGNKNEYILLTLRNSDGLVIGLLGAQITVPHFSNDRVAMEWLWYVEPEYRGLCSIKLLKAYLYWAFDVMKCDHATMSTLDSDLAGKLHKLYTKIGFSKQENTYIIGRG